MKENDQSVMCDQDGQVRNTVHRLLDEAKATAGEQRANQRVPFFMPVTVVAEDDGEERSFSCFSRDISPSGIGLLHSMPLWPGKVLIKVFMETASDVCFQGEIAWCRSCGEGWYLSGTRLLAVASAD